MKITIEKASRPKNKPNVSELEFGKYSTDHMFLMDYIEEKGWCNARIIPYQDLVLDPMAMVLHYNQEIFEGLKAYSLDKENISLFRPQLNIERFNKSAKRLVMPQVEPEFVLQAMKELILLDQEWIPKKKNTSLYIRPTMIATEPALGVRPSRQYLFYIILSPVGSYYSKGFNPTKILVSDTYTRAAKGGIGEAKTSANYGATLLAYQSALKKGYEQVLWLDAKEKSYIEEVGNSNIFFYFKGELVTPPLSGTILDGVTRKSVIQLAEHMNIRVVERPITIEEVCKGCHSGHLKEAFATGTAAIISPVGEIAYKEDKYYVSRNQIGELTKKLYDDICGIQYGIKEDPFNWCYRVL